MVIAKLNCHICVHSERSHTLRKQSSDCQSLFSFGKFHHVKCADLITKLKDATEINWLRMKEGLYCINYIRHIFRC